MNSIAKLKAFNTTYACPSKRVDIFVFDAIASQVQKTTTFIAKLLNFVVGIAWH